jgi:hypothetical protein
MSICVTLRYGITGSSPNFDRNKIYINKIYMIPALVNAHILPYFILGVVKQ